MCLVFDSSKCKKCQTATYLSLLIAKIPFALAGVIFLLILNVTHCKKMNVDVTIKWLRQCIVETEITKKNVRFN